MKKNILMRTNLLICSIIVIGFAVTAYLSYRTNFSSSLDNIEQVSSLASENIYHQMTTQFAKPVNVSLTMANDTLLRDLLLSGKNAPDDGSYIRTISEYLDTYRKKYGYDSVFLVSASTGHYYSFNGLDRVLTRDNPENVWFYTLLENNLDYKLVVDNDEVSGAGNQINLFVNCKVYDTDGSVIGIVGVGLSIDNLQNLIKEYKEEYGVNAYLMNTDGTIEISANHTGYDNMKLKDEYKYADSLFDEVHRWNDKKDARSFWTAKDGQETMDDFIVLRYIQDLDWYLVVERDTGALVRSLNAQITQSVVIIVAIIAVVLLIIASVIRSFNRQIITLTRRYEQERQNIFEEATSQLFDNIYELDITGNRPADRATAEYFKSLGVPPGMPYDKSLRVVAEKQIKPEFRQGYINMFLPENVKKAYENGTETLKYEFMISDGEAYYWMRITARIVRVESDNSIHMFTYRQNIDAEKNREKHMKELARTDEMTGLFTKTATRRLIEQRLTEESDTAYAFFIFDIDSFKQANDLHGHSFGDSVIVSFAGTIREYFGKDNIIGRIGGDEFAAFSPVTGEEQARKSAQELSAALNQIHTQNTTSWHVTASIGIALFPSDGDDFDTLYRSADHALYETKGRGRNGYTLYGKD